MKRTGQTLVLFFYGGGTIIVCLCSFFFFFRFIFPDNLNPISLLVRF